MKTLKWKQFWTLCLASLFFVAAQSATFAQGRPGGGQRPPNAQRGQRPPDAQREQRPNRENSPYAEMYKNGQVKPPEARGNRRRP